MRSIRTLVIDDEPLARAGLVEYLQRIEFLAFAGEASDGLQALQLIQSTKPDLLLLDVQMPGLSGLDLLRSLNQPPCVILTTAHPAFAVESYTLEVTDYLLKPIRFPRFLQAVLRVQQQLNNPQRPAAAVPTTERADHVFIRQEGRIEKIQFSEVQYLESMQNYVKIHTDRGVFVPLLTLKHCLARFPSSNFLQIHKSYAVNLDRVEALAGNQLIVNGQHLPISRSKREEVEQRVLRDRLL